MVARKQGSEGELIWVFAKVCIYKRKDIWQFRMWLDGEGKYVRTSLNTKDEASARKRAEDKYIEVRANQMAGKKHFSITAEGGVNRYLASKWKEVELGTIVKGRYGTVSTHLNHWLDYIGRNKKLKELEANAASGYFHHRIKEKPTLSHTTLYNEQSTINSMMAFLFKEKHTRIDAFDFPKLAEYSKNNEDVRRATFTEDEYMALVRAMRAYCAKRRNKLSDEDYRQRNLLRNYILIAANSGMRSGEQQQLCWKWVKTVQHKKQDATESQTLADIFIPKHISKVRKDRQFLCRRGQYFNRVKTYFPPKSPDDLIFSFDGKTRIKKEVLAFFKKMMKLAGIQNVKERKLVPYSLRHYMITQRVKSGLTFQQVAEMVGTSEKEIRDTYYHLSDDRRLTNAVADYKRLADGTIVTI